MVIKKINDDEWKKKLTLEQYKVLREKATERPFTGKYWNSKEKGMFVCAGCGQKLFSSDSKFDSGTGWPSFSKALPGSVKFIEDNSLGMSRLEVVCSKCGGHLGHIFDDGPKNKGGKRFCINSCSLDMKI
jgi:peptide-methionine (R)-S-oxide reductase